MSILNVLALSLYIDNLIKYEHAVFLTNFSVFNRIQHTTGKIGCLSQKKKWKMIQNLKKPPDFSRRKK